jgi:hypothetical protein
MRPISQAPVAAARVQVTQTQLDAVLASFMRPHRWWPRAMMVATVLSTVDVSRSATGDVAWSFRLSALTAGLLALIWLPTLLRLLIVSGGSIKTPAGEASTRGLMDVLGTLTAETKRETIPSVLAALTSPEAFAGAGDRVAIRGMRRELSAELATATDGGSARERLDRYAEAYEELRAGDAPGHDRTQRMTRITAEARALARTKRLSCDEVRELLASGSDGERVIALSIAQDQPDKRLFDLVDAAIRDSRSAFEQYHALGAASEVLADLDPGQRVRLRETLTAIEADPRSGVAADPGRSTLVDAMLRRLRRP